MTREELIELMAQAGYTNEPVIGRVWVRPNWDAARDYEKAMYLDRAARAIDAISEAGLAVVPREPTEAMALEGWQEESHARGEKAIYRAMVRAGDILSRGAK